MISINACWLLAAIVVVAPGTAVLQLDPDAFVKAEFGIDHLCTIHYKMSLNTYLNSMQSWTSAVIDDQVSRGRCE